MFKLMKLPYARDALEPVISKEIIDYHYGKHHQGYVNNLNKLIEGTAYNEMSLEDIIRESTLQGTGGPWHYKPAPLYNNAAQVYNHNVYWNSLRPKTDKITDKAEERINEFFGSLDGLKTALKQAATKHFGSGWVWVCEDDDKSLHVRDTHDAGCPIVDSSIKTLLVIDVWEHAYYLEYKNDRGAYIDAIWDIVDWDKLA